MMKTSNYSAI